MLLCPVSVIAQTFPDAARPGAQRLEPDAPRLPPDIGPLFEVTPALERPLDVDAGEKVKVQRFELTGMVDRPEQGISRADLERLLEEQRRARPDGFTVGQLQQVADRVTGYYRERGLLLAQAVVPVQTVSEGVVEIEVLEGILGRVLVEGNTMYEGELLSGPFAKLLNRPVTQEAVESAMLSVSDLPGLTAFGVFQPGQDVGQTDLVIKVDKERRFEGEIRYDNHGVRETGERRARFEAAVNNPTGSGDRLELIGLHTFMPDNSYYYGAHYQRPLRANHELVEVGYDRNPFDVGGAFRNQDIFGETESGYLGWTHRFVRSRQNNLSSHLELNRKQARTEIRGAEINRDDLTVLSASLDYDAVDSRYSGINAASLRYHRGFNDFLGAMGSPGDALTARVRPSRQGGSGRFAAGQFDKWSLYLTRLQSLRPLGDAFRHQSLLLRGELHSSNDLLVPLEQYAIGGPNNVRAYQPAEVLFDEGWFFSAEWIINAPGFADEPAHFGTRTWGEMLQLSLFYDAAGGRLNDPLPTDRASGNYNGAGVSVTFNNPDAFATRFTFASPINGPEPVNERNPQYWIDLSLFF
jgi:hemolysin activation/secretion protein